MYSALEAGEMVCMNSDSKGDDVGLAEEFLSLDSDSDWKERMEMYKIVKATTLRRKK